MRSRYVVIMSFLALQFNLACSDDNKSKLNDVVAGQSTEQSIVHVEECVELSPQLVGYGSLSELTAPIVGINGDVVSDLKARTFGRNASEERYHVPFDIYQDHLVIGASSVLRNPTKHNCRLEQSVTITLFGMFDFHDGGAAQSSSAKMEIWNKQLIVGKEKVVGTPIQVILGSIEDARNPESHLKNLIRKFVKQLNEDPGARRIKDYARENFQRGKEIVDVKEPLLTVSFDYKVMGVAGAQVSKFGQSRHSFSINGLQLKHDSNSDRIKLSN